MDHIEDNNFQVAVKALFFESGKLMMVKEASGVWELPGGRIQKGENFIDALKESA